MENRTLKLHHDIIYKVIYSQAGSLGKALLEGIMNSIDAGASRCEITLDRNCFRITDDGKGFSDRQAIESYFETFGTPHQDGDARYGRFRIGRGQLFAFADTTWRSGGFEMAVDVKNKGVNYGLKSDLTPHPGCRIDGKLYTPLKPSELDATLRELGDLAAWAEIPVLLNGKQINTLPASAKWDIETPEAYINLRGSGH